MTANSTFRCTMARYLLLSVAIAVLGLTWGCGGDTSQAPLDAAAQARVQGARESTRKFMEKKRAKQQVALPERK
jgi:hypothetical protein